jgi:Zn-dependent protease with chaperone function
MFNNIILFIIVLLIFNVSYAERTYEHSLIYTLVMFFMCWLVFAGYCCLGFRRLLGRRAEVRGTGGSLSGDYQSLVLRLSILAVFLFGLDVYTLDLKYWLGVVPGLVESLFLQGLFAISLFLFYLSTIWHFACPAYTFIFDKNIARRSFIGSNAKLNLPILLPWLILSLVYDLVFIAPWPALQAFLDRSSGHMVFFASFLVILMIFLPRLVQWAWGCTPFEPSGRVVALETFLREKAFRYRRILRWPIFESRMMTAGIMGVVPRYRYILVTDALMETLSLEELKAVMAHEMAHARYFHMVFYSLFIAGYMLLLLGFFESDFYPRLIAYMFEAFLEQAVPPDLFYLVMALPILVAMVVYFRYVMGFFMRQFERQADLYSAVVMESPAPTISSLEKIAFYTGKSREVPSWHHFSIKERVDCLWRTLRDPLLVRRHNRFVAAAFGVYLICLTGLGYVLNFSTITQDLAYGLIAKVAQDRIQKDPDNVALYESLAMLYHNMEKYEEAILTYERLLSLDPKNAAALNNLAWILVTAPEEGMRDRERALVLAGKAVQMERSAVFLDTLAEACYANGLLEKALTHIDDAISLAKTDKDYYEKQRKKFQEALKRGPL